MARKLRTYRTSAGFFHLAVAAPSMKAALAAWGAGANLFQQGFASVTDDPAIVAATQARPGVVLRRPVGTTGPFREHADPPTDLPAPLRAPRKPKASQQRPPGRLPSPRDEDRADQERTRRRAAIEAAEAALKHAREQHEARLNALDAERADIDRRIEVEDERWRTERGRLETALRQTRDASLRGN